MQSNFNLTSMIPVDFWRNDHNIFKSHYAGDKMPAFPWPYKKHPVIRRAVVFQWDDVPFVEIQLHYRYDDLWTKAVYKLQDGKIELISHKDV